MPRARAPETCMVSDQGIFAEIIGFMKTGPKICPEKRPKSVEQTE
jgi:hypothetical protein